MSRISVVRRAARAVSGVGALLALLLAGASRDSSRDAREQGLDPVDYRATWEQFPGARRQLRERFPELHARAFGEHEG